MYAVIKTGGKQYKVSPGDVLEVEHLKVKGESAEVSLTPLLVVTDQSETVAASDRLSEFPVTAKILGDTKGQKVTVFKYRSKSGYASKNGHRQLYSLIQITGIGGVKASQIKTAEDVQPESTGPQKPAPAEKIEPQSEDGSAASDAGENAASAQTNEDVASAQTTEDVASAETTAGAASAETAEGARSVETAENAEDASTPRTGEAGSDDRLLS